MAQLEVKVVKDTEIRNLVCAPNTIVLAKQSTISNANTGAVTTKVRYIEVCAVKKTDSESVLKSLVKYILAEHYVCKGFERDFADTKIKQKKIFNQFLSEKNIYRTDSDGKISHVLESEVDLRNTGVNIQSAHKIVNCEKKNLDAAIHQHCKAIKVQFQYRSMVIKQAEELEKELAETTAKTTKPNRKKTSGATAHIPGVTVPAAAPVAAQA